VLSEGASFAKTMIGTPYYLSPELCEAKAYNEKTDVWAFGCVVYEMCSLRHPFDAKNQAALLMKIINGQWDAPIPSSYSAEIRDLIEQCLAYEFSKRPSMAEVVAGPSAQSWAKKLSLKTSSQDEAIEHDPKLAEARKRWLRVNAQVGRMHADAVKGLDAPTRLIWDSLYRILRAKMACDELTEADHDDIMKHVFEELPIEHTELISKVWKILPLQHECDQYMAIIEAGTGLLPESATDVATIKPAKDAATIKPAKDVAIIKPAAKALGTPGVAAAKPSAKPPPAPGPRASVDRARAERGRAASQPSDETQLPSRQHSKDSASSNGVADRTNIPSRSPSARAMAVSEVTDRTLLLPSREAGDLTDRTRKQLPQ